MSSRDAPTQPGTTGDCLRIDELVAMVEGRLTEERAERAIEHVDGCPECAELIANLGTLDEDARRIDRYQIERVLGTGGMGIVYVAFDPELQRRLAIKLVRPDATSSRLRPMMLEEARTLARLSHPNVVTVYDVGEHDGELFVATELVDGMTLADWQHGKSEDEILGAWIQVARGLAAAHEAGVVHRDVKPSNIFVGRDGRVRVGDFGIASSAATDVVAGTPAYMAPEQKSGTVDARSDQYATCVGIVEALTGTRPSADATIELPNARLAAALTRGLRGNPGERFPTMLALAEALAPPAKRNRKLLFAALAAGAIAVGAIAVLAMRPAAQACTLDLARTWSPARAEKLAALGPMNVNPAIERWTSRWSAAAAEVCASGDAARTRCLATTLDALDRVLAGWELAPPRTAMAMYITLDELPHVEACSSAALAAAGDPAERNAAREVAAKQSRSDPALAAQTLRAAIAKPPDDFSKVRATIDLMSVLGTDQLAELEALAVSAKQLIAKLGGDVALDAEVDLRRGQALGATDRTDEAIAALEHARVGMAVAYGEGSPQEASVLVSLAGAYYRRDGTASPEARAAGKRADEIWANHRITMPSTVLPSTPAEIITQIERAQAAQREQNSGVEAEFDSEYALTTAYMIAGKPVESLDHGMRALALADKLSKQTPRNAQIRAHVASLLVDAKREAEALPHARQAVAIAERLGANTELATSRGVLGRTLVELGKLADARAPLEAALAHLTKTNAPARLRGTTRFFLARARADKDMARVARAELDSAFATPELDEKTNPIAAPYMRREITKLIAEVDRFVK